ncbi:Predicted DNA-binding transcriptional regulator YafY, contains an HTH and WYL domains [Raineyella antarctica]|uniref:Predicted DNA-binding transcriptional regulator YafY, contains an HTH and WYL domains n=1 Tax=Raineyella antarctica TaxID=1577474 RepID=A0A1G6H7V1_9ACTN|nr:WYL domain-containing protein [Raineyella antarctica]SDB90168.1 Predicted DNA-binding transcriptional regulator YafY, contains an HTH and WYL domains [Raineyella antarctica]
MVDVTERLLATVGLLQSRTRWSSTELAAALEVSESTVRRYIARLREWGLEIVSGPGSEGGYRLTHGRQMPPLVLDDDGAAAVAIALRRALLSPEPLVEEATLKAMASVLQVLPARVRESVAAHDTEATAAGQALERSLGVITEGLRCGCVLRFHVLTDGRRSAMRFVEPLAVRARGGQWYLMGHDRDLSRIATWAVEQITDAEVTTIRFSGRNRRARQACEALPDDSPDPVVAVLEVDAPPGRVRAGLPEGVGFIEPLDDGRCRVIISGTSVSRIARQLLQLPELFTVIEPEDLRWELRAIGQVLASV